MEKRETACGITGISYYVVKKEDITMTKEEYTIEGMHIKEEGYRQIYPEFMKNAMEPLWNKYTKF